MTEPKRFQLRRTRGWRKPDGGISVARPTRWGNPYPTAGEYRVWVFDPGRTTGPPIAEIKQRLRGHDLGCWCPLDQPCHADVLLEIANS
jgi:hypothetical protein